MRPQCEKLKRSESPMKKKELQEIRHAATKLYKNVMTSWQEITKSCKKKTKKLAIRVAAIEAGKSSPSLTDESLIIKGLVWNS